LDTGRSVHVAYEPNVVPAPKELSAAIGPALSNGDTASVARFRSLWNGRVEDILEADARVVRIQATG
ncbi:MAG: hypothetical protein WBH61_09815, partial [Candidatus Methylomirabilis sp.]